MFGPYPGNSKSKNVYSKTIFKFGINNYKEISLLDGCQKKIGQIVIGCTEIGYLWTENKNKEKTEHKHTQ